MARTKVILADDYEPMLDRLRTLFRDDFDIVALARDGKAALEAVLEHTPALVILDIAMPVLSGFEAARLIRMRLPEVKILFFTNHSSAIYRNEALRIGCAGLVSKLSSAEMLRHSAWQALRSEASTDWAGEGNSRQRAVRRQPVLGVSPG